MQGFNMGRYIPPDLEGTLSSNAASGKGHALGARARKLKTEGILTVRFECPFAIWCTNCAPEQIIGQGVRFNAEKKKVGNYFSSAIWSFRFKHTVCGGWIEVRTDPKNAEYVVVEGGRRRDLGLEKVLDGEVRVGASGEEKERIERDGGFGALERKVVDKRKLLDEKGRLEELEARSGRHWEDPYEKSKVLRREFRIGRRKRAENGRTAEALKDKLSLGIEMLDELEEDGERAKLVQFGEDENLKTRSRPMFEENDGTTKSTPKQEQGGQGKKLSRSALIAEKKVLLRKNIVGNTRAVVDPFLRDEDTWQPRAKRKRPESMSSDSLQSKPSPVISPALVSYDSDSSEHH